MSMVTDHFADRMGAEPVLSVKRSVTIDIMLNRDGDAMVASGDINRALVHRNNEQKLGPLRQQMLYWSFYFKRKQVLICFL